jgi:signal transduction histidine kinase
VRQSRPIKVRSLTNRVLTIATLWAVIALVVIAFIISTLYRQGTERGFKEVLRAQLYNVVNSVSISAEGRLEGNPQFGDLRYAQPQTGWYWIVDPLGEDSARLASVSIGGRDLPIPDTTEVPFDTFYERAYEVADPYGNTVLVVETEVELDEARRAARFRVTGNLEAVEEDVSAFTQSLAIAFLIFGLGSLAANAGAILIGLRPLDTVRQSLENIRNGKSTALEGQFPREIAPLAGEVNALIEGNRRVVDRARMQVGNLAHSLKTPIAVLLNEARRMGPEHAELVRGQAVTMQNQVQTYLNRARIAAQAGSVLARAEAHGVLERLLRVMQRLNPGLRFELDAAPRAFWFAMEQQDIEEVAGNLLENAAKFARDTIRVTVVQTAPPASAPDAARVPTLKDERWLNLVIEDDGPGLEEEEIVEAMKRGSRLDESKPGTGLGLSIVLEIAREYGGMVKLDRGTLGGLRATVTLPSVRREATEA